MSQKKKAKDADDYFTFSFFNDKFKSKNDKVIVENWKEIKDYFLTIEEWYLDRVLYHKIGFLVASGTHIGEILSERHDPAHSKDSKTQFAKYLDSKIQKKIPDNIDELEYGDARVKNVLLLHNIQTMLNNNLETTKFPFDRFKKKEWDIEHIAAIAEEKSLNTPILQNKWLDGLIEYIEDKQLRNEASSEPRDFDKLYPRLLDYFSEEKKHKDINDISNLALLNVEINRSYKNTVFARKREEIIRYDKLGTFIPICTKNIFMKYYSYNVKKMSYWGEEDRNGYHDDILKTLSVYSKKGEIE
jgi:hypothetical protein